MGQNPDRGAQENPGLLIQSEMCEARDPVKSENRSHRHRQDYARYRAERLPQLINNAKVLYLPLRISCQNWK